MHHRPVGPPLSARLSAAATRGLRLARRALSARLGLGVLLTAVVTAVVLAVPVVSRVDAGSPEVGLGASSSSASRDAGSPVVMGLDGGTVASSPLADASTEAPPPEQPTTAPHPTGAAPVPPVPPVPQAAPPARVVAPAPAVVPAQSQSQSQSAEAKREAPSVAAAAPTASEPAPAPTAAAVSGREDEVLALVNAARATAGCAPLVEDADLAAVARAHSEDMRDRDQEDSDPPGRPKARAESTAHGVATAAAVMDQWMSSDHRANILDCEMRTHGLGIADGPGGPWWTQLLGD